MRVTLKKMLERESELRLSLTSQRQMADAEREHKGGHSWLDIVNQIQHQVVQEFKFSNIQFGLQFLRSVWVTYPEDKELHNVAHWIKYNQVRPADHLLGTRIPSSIQVFPLHESSGLAVSVLTPEIPIQVFVASSIS